MPEKQPLTNTESPDGKGRSWRPPAKRDVVSEEGLKWQHENAEAAEAWAKWAEEHGLPLRRFSNGAHGPASPAGQACS